MHLLRITFYTVSVALLKVASGNEKVELYTTWTTTVFAGIQNEQHILVRPLTKDISVKYAYDSTELSSRWSKGILVMLQAYLILRLLEDQQGPSEGLAGFLSY